MTAHTAEQHIQTVRSFNRFYTGQIGLLSESVYQSPFSLTDVRVLYELAHRAKPTAAELCRDLHLDAGYLSRILSKFKKRGLISKTPSESDGRRSLLALTARGRKAFAPLDERANVEMAKMLDQLPEADQQRLVRDMNEIQHLLGSRGAQTGPYLLRGPQPGDIGWVVHRHGALYAQEYGWDERFEALVAEIAAKFVQNFDTTRERCWIAERDGEILGSVFLVKDSDEIARLRLLLVEPKARGLGLGKRLVEECVKFARRAGYKKITLWTQSVLDAARHVYQKAGFVLVHKEPYRGIGRDLVSETWDLEL